MPEAVRACASAPNSDIAPFQVDLAGLASGSIAWRERPGRVLTGGFRRSVVDDKRGTAMALQMVDDVQGA